MHFSSIPGVNNNQTINVDALAETSRTTLTAIKGILLLNKQSMKYSHFIASISIIGLSAFDTVDDPDLNVDNVLNCRANTILSFSVRGTSAPNGIIIAMNIRPLSGGLATQTLFSIRGSSTNVVPFRAELSDSTGYLTFHRKDSDGIWNNYPTTLALQKGKTNFVLLQFSNQ